MAENENKQQVYTYKQQDILQIISILETQITGINNNKFAEAIKNVLCSPIVENKDETNQPKTE